VLSMSLLVSELENLENPFEQNLCPKMIEIEPD